MGYRTCVKCSSEVKWSAVPVINHKTGNEIQIVKDPEVAAEFMAKSARCGFGTLRGMTTGYRKPRIVENREKKIEQKPIQETITVKEILPNEYEQVGSELMHIFETNGYDSAYNHIQNALISRRIFGNHAKQLHSILKAISDL